MTALANFCNWNFEGGKDELFPFDVINSWEMVCSTSPAILMTSPTVVKAIFPDKTLLRSKAFPGEGDAETQNSPVSFFIGMAVASDPTVELAPLKFEYLDKKLPLMTHQIRYFVNTAYTWST
ncbi:hypothetical protein E2C01_051960 [Portunus trituberculatus]|uniref:Uncharacterized protein n=1 Tax=Portunus trituberculatus TaxID=210409 RepID=A0A5B7GLT3_PORTR|nr:hypothetical protein [Portunus trituberculatus]